MSETSIVTRRRFLGVAAAGAGAILDACASAPRKEVNRTPTARLMARPAAPTASLTPGLHPLGLTAERDSTIYVPRDLSSARPAPLLVLLHGSGGSATSWPAPTLAALADPVGAVIVVPSSSGATWDLRLDGYGPDVEAIDAALQFAFKHCAIDPTRLGLAGFSDGASYALSLGLQNGDLFSALLAFSPGVCATDSRRGKPRIFIAHGTGDTVLPYATTSGVIVPTLRSLGYDVTFRTFEGGHTVEMGVAVEGVGWFAGTG